MDVLAQLEQAVRTVAERVGPAVVGVGRGWGTGSGIVVAEGRVLTNAHHVRGEQLAVSFADGRREPASVAGIDLESDLTVLSVDTGGVDPVAWPQEPSPAASGQAVFALSNPGGRGTRTTLGFITCLDRSFRGPGGRRITGAIEHDAALPRGSSGGPLVDATGSLAGVNTHRLGEGFYLALPADEALRQRVEALGRGEQRTTRRLGVAVAPAEAARRLRAAVGLAERDGLLVRGVDEEGPAAAAGIQVGDLIVAAGDQPITTGDALFAVLDRLQEDELPLTVVRGADERTVTVAFPA